MLLPAAIEDTARLVTIKDGLGESGVLARFQSLSTVNVTWYIWWVNHQPIGWVLIQWEGKMTAPTNPDLFDLYVHVGYRSRGVGTQILLACEQTVRDAGYDKLGLAVNPDLNPRAYKLYQRLGYQVISQDKYLDGIYGGVEDWVIDLEKDLQLGTSQGH